MVPSSRPAPTEPSSSHLKRLTSLIGSMVGMPPAAGPGSAGRATAGRTGRVVGIVVMASVPHCGPSPTPPLVGALNVRLHLLYLALVLRRQGRRVRQHVSQRVQQPSRPRLVLHLQLPTGQPQHPLCFIGLDPRLPECIRLDLDRTGL